MPKVSAKFDLGHPLRGRQMQVGWVTIGDFRQITGYISKTVKIDVWFLLKSNRKLYALYRTVALPMTLSAPKPPHFLHFAPPFIASQQVNLETSNLVHWLTIASPTMQMKNLPRKGRGQGQLTRFTPHCNFSTTANAKDSNFVHRSVMRSVILVMSECSLSGRGQGHVSNFCTWT